MRIWRSFGPHNLRVTSQSANTAALTILRCNSVKKGRSAMAQLRQPWIPSECAGAVNCAPAL